MKRDRRMRVLEAALYNPELSYAERAFMAVVCTVRTEYLDGQPRHGSRGMTPDGKFTLHLDYLAGALGTSQEGVRKIRRSLEAKQVLSEVHKATHGRPTTWQANVVRGAKNGSLTTGEKGTPYGFAGWLTRVAEKAPLTYRDTQGRDPAPTSGAARSAKPEVSSGSYEEAATGAVTSDLPHVWWHREPPDLDHHEPESREATS